MASTAAGPSVRKRGGGDHMPVRVKGGGHGGAGATHWPLVRGKGGNNGCGRCAAGRGGVEVKE
jgi:hypothetical protein